MIRSERFQDWVGRDSVPWSTWWVRMNRDKQVGLEWEEFLVSPVAGLFPTYAAEEEEERKSKRKPRDDHAHKYSYLSRIIAPNH